MYRQISPPGPEEDGCSNRKTTCRTDHQCDQSNAIVCERVQWWGWDGLVWRVLVSDCAEVILRPQCLVHVVNGDMRGGEAQ
jgi:hypothetical protein